MSMSDATELRRYLNYYIHDGSHALRFELAGGFSKDTASDLEQAWRTTSPMIGERRVVFDFSRVSFVTQRRYPHPQRACYSKSIPSRDVFRVWMPHSVGDGWKIRRTEAAKGEAKWQDSHYSIPPRRESRRRIWRANSAASSSVKMKQVTRLSGPTRLT